MKHKLLLLYSWAIRIMLFFAPDIPFIMRFRGWLYSLGMKQCGKDFQITHDANIKGLEEMIVGNNVYIANNVIIILRRNGGLLISDEVMVAPHCILVDGNHGLFNNSFRRGKGKTETIKIGRGSWIAANCCVLAGAELPEACILSANSCLLTKEKKSHSIYGGSPASFIREI